MQLMHNTDHVGSASRSLSLSKSEEGREEYLNYLQGVHLGAGSLGNDLL